MSMLNVSIADICCCYRFINISYALNSSVDFTSEEPARAAFQAAALPKGAKVEIEAIACVNTT